MKSSRTTDIRRAVCTGAFALLLVFTFLVTLTSCGASYTAGDMESQAYNGMKAETTSASMDYVYASDDAFYDMAAMEAPAEMKSQAESGSGANNTQQQNDLAARKLIKTARLTVETKNFDDFIRTIEGNIASLGGYLSSTSINGGGADYNRIRNASLTVRIPADSYDAFVSGISGYGNVTYKTESVDDVTMAYVDTESRIKAYETEYDTLLDILEKATSLDDVLIIQNRITEVTYQLESYRSQLRKYDDLISYCTVHINVNEVVELTEIKEPPATLGQRMVRGFSDTCRDIADDAKTFAVWFVSSFPLLVIYAIVIFLLLFFGRKIYRRVKPKILAKFRKSTVPADTPAKMYTDEIDDIINDEKYQ